MMVSGMNGGHAKLADWGMSHLEGIAASGGSACTAGSRESSHVLRAVGLSEREAKGSLRMTVGIGNTEDEIRETVGITEDIVKDLRAMYRG